MDIIREIPLYDQIKDKGKLRHLTSKERVKVNLIYDAFTNGGLFADDKGTLGQVDLMDLVTSTEIAKLVPNVVQQITYEALLLDLQILPALFKRVSLKPGTTQLTIRGIGEIHAAMIPEAGEYPEAFFGGGTTEAIRIQINKYGTKISLTDESVNESQFDVINLWIRAAGRALARLREKNAATALMEAGTTVIDNFNPAASEIGSCTGRDIAGYQNGSMTYDDMYEMFIYGSMRGFNFDTLLMSPLAWRIFSKDTTIREMLENGAHWNPFQGRTASGWNTTFQGLGLRTRATGSATATGLSGKIGANPWVTTLNPLGSTFYTKPVGPFGNMKVVVSPFVPFTKGAASYTDGTTTYTDIDTTNIIIADSNNAGIFVSERGPTQGRWEDPERDIQNIKLYEKYGLYVIEQGKGVAIAKDVSILPNYVFDNTNSVTLAPLDRSTSFSGT